MGATDNDHRYEQSQNLIFDQSDPKKQSQFSSSKNDSLRKNLSSHKPAIILYVYLILFTGSIFGFRWFNLPRKSGCDSYGESMSSGQETSPSIKEYTLACSETNVTQTCPANLYPTRLEQEISNSSHHENICPEYFKWIAEDLKPWKINGISREMVEAAKNLSFFRLVVVNGRVYVDMYRKAYQTRDVFTIWGILQLLRLYPGRLPDLDMMFEVDDKPVFKKVDYKGPKASQVPPMFQYCGDEFSYDIVIPDWSFWGWPEINIKPWEQLVKDLEEGNRKIKWVDRRPYAYWKGNLKMGKRQYLLGCNSTEWGAEIFRQQWIYEQRHGFTTSNLAEQCTHRYKIYIEGRGWSVSEKYNQACDSMLLMVQARYYEFFTRSLVPMKHYWPLGGIGDICRKIKQAVDWGNNNPQKAEEIGRAGSRFVMEELKMQNVYDYMFHLLNEYGKLLRYQPTVPAGAVEVCSETMACPAKGKEKEAKMGSMVKAPSTTTPCFYNQ